MSVITSWPGPVARVFSGPGSLRILTQINTTHRSHEPTSASPTAAALLGEVQPALVEVLARQCMGSPKWTAEEWRLALGGGAGGRRAARLLQGEGDGGDDDAEEEGFGRLADVLSFRSEAVDAAESMASGWPKVRGCVAGPLADRHCRTGHPHLPFYVP